MADTNATVAPGKISSGDLANAQRAARDIITQSVVLQGCVTTMIFTRHLFDATRALMEAELNQWEMENTPLVFQTLMAAAHAKGMQPANAQDLHRTCIDTILPFVDSMMQLQLEAQRRAAAASPTENQEASDVNGTDVQPATDPA